MEKVGRSFRYEGKIGVLHGSERGLSPNPFPLGSGGGGGEKFSRNKKRPWDGQPLMNMGHTYLILRCDFEGN